MTVLYKSGIGFLDTIRSNGLPDIELTSDQANKQIGIRVLKKSVLKLSK